MSDIMNLRAWYDSDMHWGSFHLWGHDMGLGGNRDSFLYAIYLKAQNQIYSNFLWSLIHCQSAFTKNVPDRKKITLNWRTPNIAFKSASPGSNQCKFCKCCAMGATLRCRMTFAVFCIVGIHWEIPTKNIHRNHKNSSTTMNTTQKSDEFICFSPLTPK